MLAVTGALQNSSEEMLKLMSAYQTQNDHMETLTNSQTSVYDSKETSPEIAKSQDDRRTESELITDDGNLSDCDTNVETEELEVNIAFTKALDRALESDMEVETLQMPIINAKDAAPDFNNQEQMPELQAQTNLSDSCAASPSCQLKDLFSITPSREKSSKKRTAAKYFTSVPKQVEFDDEKWYRCIIAPKELYGNLIFALGVSSTPTCYDDYVIYACEDKDKYNCPYRLRMKTDLAFLVCEQNGCHWHDSDTEFPETSKNTSTPYRGWFACFDGPITLKTPFMASLCVATRHNFNDGYEMYDCLYQKKFKCDYKVRVKVIDNYFICEELGTHRHGVEKEVVSTTGLPPSFKDVVDIAFYQNWTYSVRQQKLADTAAKLGIVWDRKLTRQIDNRLSYLRRTSNIKRAVEFGKQRTSQD